MIIVDDLALLEWMDQADVLGRLQSVDEILDVGAVLVLEEFGAVEETMVTVAFVLDYHVELFYCFKIFLGHLVNVVDEIHDLRPVKLVFLGLVPWILNLGVHEAVKQLERGLQVAKLEVAQNLVGKLLSEQSVDDRVRHLELLRAFRNV